MFGIGGWEMLLIGVVALLVFGPKRLPELARSLGRGLAEFRRASSDLRRSMDLEIDPTREPAPDPETQPPAQAGQPAIGSDSQPEPQRDSAQPGEAAEAKSGPAGSSGG
jgi:TatA/E family protein of Tat protein translocase